MKKVYLYLDESGDFATDGSMRDNPSLVGGYLKYDTAMSDEEAEKLCSGKPIHCCKLPVNIFALTAISVLPAMKEQGCHFVLFENKERLEILDGDTTYLNIISEGVVQLMQLLKSRYGEIDFNLVVAQRVAVNRPDYKYNPDGYYIAWSEYENRLKEKIIIGASKIASAFNTKNWKIEFANGNTDFRLMLADIVCHSRFRENKKFDENQRKILKLLFNEEYIFSVFPSELETSIRRNLVKGNIAEALFELLVFEGKSKPTKHLSEIRNALMSINGPSRDLQFKILFSRIHNLLHAENELKLSQLIIERARKYYIDDPSFIGIIPGSFLLDIGLLALTIATHEGAINKAENEMEYCKSLLPSLIKRWESIDYYFIYKIRNAVHLLNAYDMIGCVNEMNALESTIDNTFTLFPLADGFSDLCEEIKSDIKGKVYGNRLQARIYLMKRDADQYQLAIEDSECAIKEFDRRSDIKRQFQYRSRIEYEARNCRQAFDWLLKSISFNNKDADLGAVLSQEIQGNRLEAAFTLMHIVNIMLLAVESLEHDIYKTLRSAWISSDVDAYLKNTTGFTHPYEIIYWKLGKLSFLTGSPNAGSEKLDLAYKICNKSKDNQSLKAIGLGILADKAYLLSQSNSVQQNSLAQAIENLTNEYELFMRMELPTTMKSYFKEWNGLIITLKDNRKINQDHSILKDLSDQVCY
jgi:hypothetical protein